MDTNHSRMKEKLKSIRVISALQMICACVIVILLIAVGSYWIFSSTLLDTIGTTVRTCSARWAAVCRISKAAPTPFPICITTTPGSAAAPLR